MVNWNRFRALITAFTAIALIMSSAAYAAKPAPPFLWEADTTLGGIADKAKIDKYLDNLVSRSINGVWIQVESYVDGTVNYKKTTVSGLPTAEKFKTGQWANDDFLSYTIGQARSRGMSVFIKFHGSNHAVWDQNPSWRMVDSKGKEVLWGGTLKNFCVNAPYWDKVFFPMMKDIGANYDVDGFYLDTCQVAYPTDDTCFCPACKARFEKETGKKLALTPVAQANWTDPAVKQHAVKRVEWLNGFYEKYGKAVEDAKPGAASMLNVSGAYNSYADGLSARHASRYVTYVTPEPVNTPRMYAVSQNKARIRAGETPEDEMKLARDELAYYMTRFGYLEFLVKTMRGEGAGKPVVPFAREWFSSKENGYMGPVDLEIAQIEAALAGGAKGYCFFGYLGTALEKGETAGTAWDDPKYLAYLKGITSGTRVKWLADMVPDSHVAILYDRDASFWNRNYWEHFRTVGGLYSLLQYWRKTPVDLVSASEPNIPGFAGTGYKLTLDILKEYDLIIAPGLDYVCKEDLETLKTYVDGGGHLLIMGAIGTRGKFLGESISDDAYEILGITTVGEPTASGFIRPQSKHPIFAGFNPSDLLGSYKIAKENNTAVSYEPKFSEGWEVIAEEVTSKGRRPCILSKQKRVEGTIRPAGIGYINCSDVMDFSGEMMFTLSNMAVVTATKGADIQPQNFSKTSSINVFKSVDGMARYIHIFTLDGEKGTTLVCRGNGQFPISAEIMMMDGTVQPIELDTRPSGNCRIVLPEIKPYYAMLRIQYKPLDSPARGANPPASE